MEMQGQVKKTSSTTTKNGTECMSNMRKVIAFTGSCSHINIYIHHSFYTI